MDLDRNNVYALHGYGDYLTITRNLEEGLSYVRRVGKKDPFAPLSTIPLVTHLFFMRRYDDTITEAQKLLELDPNFPVHGWLARIYWQQGRYEAARREYRIAWRRDSKRLRAFKRGYAEIGPKGGMLAIAERLADQSERVYVNPFVIASAFARSGAFKHAMRWLERAAEARAPELI